MLHQIRKIVLMGAGACRVYTRQGCVSRGARGGRGGGSWCKGKGSTGHDTIPNFRVTYSSTKHSPVKSLRESFSYWMSLCVRTCMSSPYLYYREFLYHTTRGHVLIERERDARQVTCEASGNPPSTNCHGLSCVISVSRAVVSVVDSPNAV